MLNSFAFLYLYMKAFIHMVTNYKVNDTLSFILVTMAQTSQQHMKFNLPNGARTCTLLVMV